MIGNIGQLAVLCLSSTLGIVVLLCQQPPCHTMTCASSSSSVILVNC
jgi:hypothetical protein